MGRAKRTGMPIGIIIREGFDIDEYIDVARRVEAAKVHLIFTAGGYGTSTNQPRGSLETLAMLCAIATQTTHTGLVATLSTTWEDPFNLTRRLASLDHISKGRAGWNIVTSSAGAENFGTSLPSHTERYERAEEFTAIAKGLWTSWDADAVVTNNRGFATGAPGGVHTIDYVGKYHSVKGPLDLPRSQQGHPVLFQSGTSDEGMDFGVRHANAIFTTGLESLEESRLIYKEIKDRAARAGRNPNEVLVFPGLSPALAPTDAEATQFLADHRAKINYESAAVTMKNMFGDIDVSGYDFDKPLPPEALPDEHTLQGRQSRYQVLRDYMLARPDRTLRDMIAYHASGAGHWVPVGSYESVADELQERYESGAADGFVIINGYNKYPNGLDHILEGLLPELQQRGSFHTEYEADTLRGLLGLPEIDGAS